MFVRAGSGLAMDGGFGYGVVLQEGGFHLERANAVGRADDHVVGASDEPEVAVLIPRGPVAGVVPVAAEAVLVRLGVAPVSGKQADRAVGGHTDRYLALLTVRAVRCRPSSTTAM